MERDGALIEWSVRGRPGAFAEVARRHEVAVHKFPARRAGPEAADDLPGEVRARAFGARGRFWPGQGDAPPWPYGIARNVLRARWRPGPSAAHGDAAAGPGEAADPWDEVIERPDSAAWSRELATAARELPAACREVLLLAAWEELTPAEAADAPGIAQGTARSRLRRARSELRLARARHLHADGAGAGGAGASRTGRRPRRPAEGAGRCGRVGPWRAERGTGTALVRGGGGDAQRRRQRLERRKGSGAWGDGAEGCSGTGTSGCCGSARRPAGRERRWLTSWCRCWR